MKIMSFKCINCKKVIETDNRIKSGTGNRNHCPHCLWSKHVDERVGDRYSECQSAMEPIGLTIKKSGVDKYGKERRGELMIIHKCVKDGKVSINRISADDNVKEITNVFLKGKKLNKEIIKSLQNQEISVLTDKDILETHLFGYK